MQQAATAARRRWLALDRTCVAAAALGAATVAGYAPLYLFPLPVFTLAAFAWLIGRAPTPRRAAMLGWWFGLGFFLTGVSWVYVSLHNFGAMPMPLAAAATFLFCAFLALFPAAAAYGHARVQTRSWMKLAVLLPALWTLTEWTRGWIFTGFPWLAVGYSQVPSSPLAGYAPVLGVFGLSLATVTSAGLVTLIAERVPGDDAAKRMRAALTHPALAVLAAVWIGGYALTHVQWTERTGEPVTVALLQGNIPQDIKWTERGLIETLSTYRRLALATQAKLVVFPETALPLFLSQVPPAYLETLAQHARANGGDMLIGVPERLPSGDYYNSVISLGTAKPQSYRKTHLVPFGEFIPLRPVLGWIVNTLAIPLQDFSRGDPHPRPLNVAGERVAVDICYEDAFGEEIIRQLPEATLLVNASNVAWFGRSIAPGQHLQISQARALETGRFMLRATNTGMTAVVDERGRVVQAAPQFETATVTAKVQGRSGATPYVRWGNYAVIALCFVLVALALVRRR